MKKMLLIFGVAATVIACSEKTAPTAVQADPEPDAPAMTADAEQGKDIFETSCTKCHGAKKIDNYSQEQWGNILPKMAVKAKLDASQTALVDAYIQWELAN